MRQPTTPWLRIKVCDFIPQRFIVSDIACYHPRNRTIWIIRRLPKRQYIWALVHELGHWLLHLAGCRWNGQDRYYRMWTAPDPYPVNRKAAGLPE